MVYYPVEKFCSRFTDKLITINKEDYELAKAKFHAKEVHYIPGVGIDLSRFQNIQVDRAAKRQEIGVPEDAFLMISVGELSDRKNHRVMLQALEQIDNENVHYVIVGKGDLLENLKSFVQANDLTGKVQFLGYRQDVAELYKAADLFCFPSLHEGLPVALMEAMACGIPAVCSRIRGNTDLIQSDAGALVDPFDTDGFAEAIVKLIRDKALREQFSALNRKRVTAFEQDAVLKKIAVLYEDT